MFVRTCGPLIKKENRKISTVLVMTCLKLLKITSVYDYCIRSTTTAHMLPVLRILVPPIVLCSGCWTPPSFYTNSTKCYWKSFDSNFCPGLADENPTLMKGSSYLSSWILFRQSDYIFVDAAKPGERDCKFQTVCMCKKHFLWIYQ